MIPDFLFWVDLVFHSIKNVLKCLLALKLNEDKLDMLLGLAKPVDGYFQQLSGTIT